MTVDDTFAALANPIRVELMERIRDQPGLTLTQLIEGLEGTRQGLSRHLEVLVSADLVITSWSGRERLHYLNPMPLVDARDKWINSFIGREAESLQRVASKVLKSQRKAKKRA